MPNKSHCRAVQGRAARVRFLINVPLLGVLLLAAAPLLRSADRPGVSSLLPQETGVLLLPALDATRDAANMQAPRQLVIRHRQQAEFIARHFKMLGETLALKAAGVSPAVDLATLSARTAENLDLLGKRAGAEWVVHTVVEDAQADETSAGFIAKTRLLLQVWDVRRHDWLVNDRYTGEATGSGAPPMIFLRSLDNATKGALASVLDAYPAVVTVEGEDSLADYLADQTAPVVGDPKKPFRAAPVQ
jgi:hypothetical protein